MIKPSGRLSKELRELVIGAFENAVEHMGEEEFFYVGNRIERKLQAVRVCRTSWVRDLAIYCEALYEMYQDHTSGNCELPSHDLQLIGATLFYFVNPYDIIPDHIPGDGYLDDAYVANLCIKALNKSHPGVVEKYARRLRRKA